MNYYNPYFMPIRPSLFGSIRNTLANSGITFGGILNGTQKTLNIINQAIPIVKQVQPVMKNAKTMFKVMNEFKKSDSTIEKNSNSNNIQSTNKEKIDDLSSTQNYEEGPTFFI